MISKVKYILFLLVLVSTSFAKPGLKKFNSELAELQANWAVRYEYDGKTTVSSGSTTQTYNWPTQMAADTPGINPKVNSSGRVKAILEWQGAGPAPKTVNILVDAKALAEGMSLMLGTPAARTVNNGYDDEVVEQESSIMQSGRHLKTLAVNNGSATYAHPVSASAVASGLGTVTIAVSVKVGLDPRFAYINVAGNPTNYKKKVTGNTKVYTVQYSNGTSENFTYNEAVAVPNDLLTGSDNPLSTGGTLYLGLPTKAQHGFYNPQLGIWSYTPTKIDPVPISFEGNVYQNLVAYERYDWESDQGGFASDLPTVLYGWDIRPNNNKYDAPLILVHEKSSGIPGRVDTSTGAIGTGGWVRLKYRWSDGVRATSYAQLEFHQDADNIQTIHQYLDFNPTVGWGRVPLEDEWVEDPIPQPVVLQPRNWVLTGGIVGGSLALGALGAMNPPLGTIFSVAAALYGLTLNLDTAGPVTKDYPAPSMSDFNDAAANGRVEPADWREHVIEPFNLGDFLWKAEFRPKYLYTHMVKDRWGVEGYKGQMTSISNAPQDMISSPKRYHFKLNLRTP